MPSLAIILGSAFNHSFAAHFTRRPLIIDTKWGSAEIYSLKSSGAGKPAYALFRHGLPHQLLPNQINYRANAEALRKLDCRALLVNSSVGVLDPNIPLYQPMLLSDLMMPENRLPDGSICTMFPEPTQNQGRLIPNEGFFSRELSRNIHALDPENIRPAEPEGLIFAYAGGPRTKTPAENAALVRLGAQVNSMTLAPEVILANELRIPCAGLVVGHKYSVPGVAGPDENGISKSLENARNATWELLIRFLHEADQVTFKNLLRHSRTH